MVIRLGQETAYGVGSRKVVEDMRCLDHAIVVTGTHPLDLHIETAAASGGEIDPYRSEALVQRLERELQNLAFGMTVIGHVPRVWRIECVGYEGEAFDEGLLDDRCEARCILTHRLLQHFDAEVHMSRLIASDSGEAPVE